MTVAQFRNDDAGYLAWLQQHPAGYVLNTHRSPRQDYLILHRATCGTISSPHRRNWTTAGTIKACSVSRAELEDWAERTAGRGPTYGCSCWRA